MRCTLSSKAIVAAVLVLSALALAQAQAQDGQRMDQVVQESVDWKRFMGSVLVARGDRIIFNKAYGSANLEWNVPDTTTTKYRLGSITKQFTAASILLLEERGKLKVDDRLSVYVADAPAAWQAITLRNLLTHTSGIPNIPSSDPQRKRISASSEQLFNRIRELPLEFKPGESWAYSNSGYLVLGYLIEKLSGMRYAEFVQQNIFVPLAMKDSGYDSNFDLIERRATGYTPNDSQIMNADFLHMSLPFSAGGLYSTTEDLLRWERALFGNKLLSAASVSKMTTPFLQDYAFGLRIDTVNGRKVIQHNGAIDGFNSHMAYYPQSDVTVVALSNLNGNAPTAIVAKLGLLAHGEKVTLTSERKEIALAQRILRKYVGTYVLSADTKVTVTLDGDQLMVQRSNQTKTPVHAESNTQFFVKDADVQWEFFVAGGEVTHLVLHQGGRDTKAPRVPLTPSPSPSAHATSSARTLASSSSAPSRN